MANLQLSAAKKMFKEIPVPIGDILSKNPKEFGCFGFNIADIDLTFAKSQAQLTSYYKEVPLENKDYCAEFLKAVRESPSKMMDFSKFAENSPFGETMKAA